MFKLSMYRVSSTKQQKRQSTLKEYISIIRYGIILKLISQMFSWHLVLSSVRSQLSLKTGFKICFSLLVHTLKISRAWVTISLVYHSLSCIYIHACRIVSLSTNWKEQLQEQNKIKFGSQVMVIKCCVWRQWPESFIQNYILTNSAFIH